MDQIITGLIAIILGVGGTGLYFFGSNFIIDRVFADQPPSFSAADFLALVSAIVLLVAFLTTPWVTQTTIDPSGETADTIVTTYSGTGLFSADFDEDTENAATAAKTGLFLVPAAAIIGIVFAFWGLFEASARGTSAIGTLLAGLLGLGYFILTFIFAGQNDAALTSMADIGFWIGLFATIVLLLQVVISRPVYTPPASQMMMKVNTDTRKRIRPWMFVAPALLALTFYLVYPLIDTIRRSLFDARTENFVGLDNYQWAFSNETLQDAFVNNILWLIVVPFGSVVFGLAVAVLADRVRFESMAKAFIFMPMAISFVGASVVWRFIYAFSPPGRPQIGLLNGVITEFGLEPRGWFIEQPWNNFFLMVILIWIQAGFAMVLISAALKSVPEETIEASRIDGASEIQIFFRIILPQIFSTIVVVYTTIVIIVLKVFDIVFVMTSGQFGTEVLANRMFREMFRFINFGRGSTIAVILMVAVLPVMYYNIRRFRQEEAMR